MRKKVLTEEEKKAKNRASALAGYYKRIAKDPGYKTVRNKRYQEWLKNHPEEVKARAKGYYTTRNAKPEVKIERKKYYEDHKDYFLRKGKEYYHKNREKCLTNTKAWYEKNKPKRKQYYEENKTHLSALTNAWQKAHPEKMQEYAKRKRIKTLQQKLNKTQQELDKLNSNGKAVWWFTICK